MLHSHSRNTNTQNFQKEMKYVRKVILLEDEHKIVTYGWAWAEQACLRNFCPCNFQRTTHFSLFLGSIGSHELTRTVAFVNIIRMCTVMIMTRRPTSIYRTVFPRYRGKKNGTHTNAYIVGQTDVRSDFATFASRETKNENSVFREIGSWKLSTRLLATGFGHIDAHTMTLAAALRLHCSSRMPFRCCGLISVFIVAVAMNMTHVVITHFVGCISPRTRNHLAASDSLWANENDLNVI